MSEEKTDKKPDVSPAAGKVEISRRRLLGSSSVIAASAVAATALPPASRRAKEFRSRVRQHQCSC